MLYPAHASRRGGTIEVRRRASGRVTARRISAGLASGKADHNKAMVPVTKGVAALVPPNVSGVPLTPRLVISSPGALRPRLPIEALRFDWLIGFPRRSHATTGTTPGSRVMAELPSVACLPAAATSIVPRRDA